MFTSLKNALLRAAIVISCIFTANAQEIGQRFSGMAEVRGLGRISFPKGEWTLEFKKLQIPPSDANRDYFVFRLSGDRLERIVFQRVITSNTIPLDNRIDGAIQISPDGVPSQELSKTAQIERGRAGTIHLLPNPPVLKSGEMELSFIYDANPRWISHMYLFRRGIFDIAIIHASPWITTPETVLNIKQDSTLLSEVPLR